MPRRIPKPYIEGLFVREPDQDPYRATLGIHMEDGSIGLVVFRLLSGFGQSQPVLEFTSMGQQVISEKRLASERPPRMQTRTWTQKTIK